MGSEKFGSWLSSTECFHNGDYSVSLIPRMLYMTRPDRSFHFDVWVWPSINVNVSRTRNSNPPSEKIKSLHPSLTPSLFFALESIRNETIPCHFKRFSVKKRKLTPSYLITLTMERVLNSEWNKNPKSK